MCYRHKFLGIDITQKTHLPYYTLFLFFSNQGTASVNGFYNHKNTKIILYVFEEINSFAYLET